MYKIILFVSTVLVVYGSAYRILCPYPTVSRSHFIVADALFKGLAAKGHEVTVISPYPPDKPILNYRHITIELSTNMTELFKMLAKEPGKMEFPLEMLTMVPRLVIKETKNMINNPDVQKIMADESFDLVILEYTAEAQIGIAAHFNCPIILFSSFKTNYRMLEIVSNPLALSYVRHPLYAAADLNRFYGRLLNFVFYIAEKLVYAYISSHFTKFHSEQFPPPKYPTHQDILDNNVAAIFAIEHFSQGDVRPLVPGVIDISGIQMTETASLLPNDLQTWMDQSTNGVILFSLGSNLEVSSLSSDRLAAIINVFKNLKENILWKADVDTIEGLSDNVRLEKWMSQIDVLQHKNLKLFITHGGLGSLIESKFYGVPVIVVPMFGDQIPNADYVVAEGWGIKLPYAEFTQERLTSALEEVLDNPKYTNRAKYESVLLRDRPLTPLQNGIFWVEYIIRHKGAHHMKSNARHLNWFQLHSLDVIGFLSAVLLIWAYLSYRMLKYVLKKLFRSKNTKVKRS